MKDLHAMSQQYDVCVFGRPNSGKSSLIQRYIHNRFIENVDPSVQDLYTKYRGPDLDPVTILDTVNVLEGYEASGLSQIKHSNGFMYVYSVTNRDTFEYIEELHYKIQIFWGPETPMPPIVLVGAKCDLEMERQVSTSEAQDMAERIGAIRFQEVSSVWGTGVCDAFEPFTTFNSKNSMEDAHSRGSQEPSPELHPNEVVSLQQMLLSPVVSLNDLSTTKVESSAEMPAIEERGRSRDTATSTENTIVTSEKTDARPKQADDSGVRVREKQSTKTPTKRTKKCHSCCVIM